MTIRSEEVSILSFAFDGLEHSEPSYGGDPLNLVGDDFKASVYNSE